DASAKDENGDDQGQGDSEQSVGPWQAIGQANTKNFESRDVSIWRGIGEQALEERNSPANSRATLIRDGISACVRQGGRLELRHRQLIIPPNNWEVEKSHTHQKEEPSKIHKKIQHRKERIPEPKKKEKCRKRRGRQDIKF
ncbi:hypothetical protein CVT26_015229, partial [Gymnopilus dilepis]